MYGFIYVRGGAEARPVPGRRLPCCLYLICISIYAKNMCDLPVKSVMRALPNLVSTVREIYACRRRRTRSMHTNLTGIVSEQERLKYEPLAKIGTQGDFALTNACSNQKYQKSPDHNGKR